MAFMNHQWTINLHDGYPALHVLLPEEYIPPSPPTLCHLKSIIFHFGIDLLYSTTVLEATKSVFQCALLETLQKYCSTGSLLLTFC